jgi:hypothetical protein
MPDCGRVDDTQRSLDSTAIYTQRLEERRGASAALERRHIQLGNVRLLIVVVAVGLAWLAFGRHAVSGWILLAPVALFTGLAIWHERLLRRKANIDRAVRYYERGMNRLQGQWAGKGQRGDAYQDPGHPYAEDLDVFGEASLFELISDARTRAGEATLARWLQTPAELEEIRSRQAGVEELRHRLDLREDLAVLGEESGAGVNARELAQWGRRGPLLDSRGLRAFLPVLAAVTFTLLVIFLGEVIFHAWTAAWVRTPLAVAVLVEAAVALHYRKRVLEVVTAVEHPAHDLDLLRSVLVRMERGQFESPKLAGLRAALETDGVPASRQIARLERWVQVLDSRDNVAVRVIGPFLMWTTQAAFGVEAWRRQCGPAVTQWLTALGEMEALSSLASHAFEHPADPFPEFTTAAPCFDGEGLGHPLLAESRCVRNDVRLDTSTQVYLISGSNMSGKSTLLRTVGCNAVLAMAGAPVRATRLRLSPLAVGASIRVIDSLQQGSSRFYAEIKRLSQLVEIAGGERKALFLLDELLHGTNSHDRRIGAEALVRTLVERGAIGLVTTHDLALTGIADQLSPQAINVHFEDQFESGELKFDYRLRPGVVHKSNALELMRSVGLRV